MNYSVPTFKSDSFTCPFCNVYAHMTWERPTLGLGGAFSSYIDLERATCSHCKKHSYWEITSFTANQSSKTGRMILPTGTIAPPPHIDMPDNVKLDYQEAREIANLSPRGASALLRLAIQNLCIHLGEQGKNINTDIGSLVSKGLPPDIQKALDIVRVVGNNAVHPGELNKDDVEEISFALFELVNLIVEDRISKPKKLKALFDKLPTGAQDAIKKRDSK